MRRTCQDIEERVARITDGKRTLVDHWASLSGPEATRETRMEVVAWLAVCQFGCRLEGGFVRDWVIGHTVARPKGNKQDPKKWIEYTEIDNQIIPMMTKEVVPSDLDCQLPAHFYFDIDKFLDALHDLHFKYECYRENWRYVILIDADKETKTGPFTIDLIEPHVALAQDRIDFDVSNLSLEKDYTRDIGMRVDITQNPYSIDLESIVQHIKNKQFQLLRPRDTTLEKRIEKMKSRGWKQTGPEVSVLPNPPTKYLVLLTPFPETNPLFVKLVEQLNEKVKGFQLVSIEEIKNSLIENSYLAMKNIIARECGVIDGNEKGLYHGTGADAIVSILNHGYDDRYYSKEGAWGNFLFSS